MNCSQNNRQLPSPLQGEDGIDWIGFYPLTDAIVYTADENGTPDTPLFNLVVKFKIGNLDVPDLDVAFGGGELSAVSSDPTNLVVGSLSYNVDKDEVTIPLTSNATFTEGTVTISGVYEGVTYTKVINVGKVSDGVDGTDLSTVITTKGDLLVFDTDLNRLPVGITGTILESDATQASGLKWGLKNPMAAKGDLISRDGSADARLAVGTDGKVLTADSSEPTGLKWATPDTDPLTTKGDIMTFDSDAQRLALGSDGQVLTVDIGEATGLKWATPSVAVTGTYTPAIASNQSTASIDAREAIYVKNGNHITVYGSVSFEKSTAGDSHTISVPLPSGTAATSGAPYSIMGVITPRSSTSSGSVLSNGASASHTYFSFIVPATASALQAYDFSFSYINTL